MHSIADFIGQVRAQQADITRALVTGHAHTFESYQRLVGRHQGLEEALEILDNLLKEPDSDG